MILLDVLHVTAKPSYKITSIRVDNVKHIYNLNFIIKDIYIIHKYNKTTNKIII